MAWVHEACADPRLVKDTTSNSPGARPPAVERLRGGVARAAPRQRPGARRVAGEGRGESPRARARRRGLHERRERLEAAARAQLL